MNKKDKTIFTGKLLYRVKYFFNLMATFIGWIFIFMCVAGFFNPLSIFDTKYVELEQEYYSLLNDYNNANEKLNEAVNITNPKFVAMAVEGINDK